MIVFQIEMSLPKKSENIGNIEQIVLYHKMKNLSYKIENSLSTTIKSLSLFSVKKNIKLIILKIKDGLEGF